MPRPSGRPDAVLYPESKKKGSRASERYKSLIQIGEEYLEVNLQDGEHAWVRRQPNMGQRCFATRGRECSLLFPIGHPLSGEARYDWFPGKEDGLQFGYLVPEAKEDIEAAKKANSEEDKDAAE